MAWHHGAEHHMADEAGHAHDDGHALLDDECCPASGGETEEQAPPPIA
jgi:hypothetical protein